MHNQKTFGFTATSELEAAVGALYKGTPGVYGALFDTAMATAHESIAALKTSEATYQPKATYSDQARLVYSAKDPLPAALQLAAQLITTGTRRQLRDLPPAGVDTD